MRLMERLYRSPFGRIMSAVATVFTFFHRPIMIYGFRDSRAKTFRKYTRLSSSVVIDNKENLSIGDQVWVSHYVILDATEELTIGEGCHIGAWVGIYTHGAEYSIRLLGHQFVHIPDRERKGYTRGAVSIGPYSFIGMKSVILPGVTIGKGCLITPGTVVNRDIPDYSIAAGRPGKVVGSTIDLDRKKFEEYDFSQTYYDPEALRTIQAGD